MVVAGVVVGLGSVGWGQAVTWQSRATGGPIKGTLLPPTGGLSAAGAIPTIIYLQNLGLARVGQEADAPIIADLRAAGQQVVVLDYAKNAAAVSPAINQDIDKLRQDITGKKFLAAGGVDPAHLYVLPEGCRVKRDVPFYTDAGHTWAMDIYYPSQPAKPVPMLMEITCDNANRMGASSLVFCQDTLVEGALLAGFASAMVDHPVYPSYKGMFPMPDSLCKMKSAVRTLRAEGKKLALADKIGVIGFSRGSPLAALLAVTGGNKDFEVGGINADVSSTVQAALLHGERYDFMALTAVDSMYNRFETAWGKRADQPQAWDAHSAIRYVSKDSPPMFLNTSDKEEVTYREQLALFEKRLTDKGVEHVFQVDPDGRGHKVTLDPKTLSAIYGFFAKHLGG
jgi:acetyl esterase/lipase